MEIVMEASDLAQVAKYTPERLPDHSIEIRVMANQMASYRSCFNLDRMTSAVRKGDEGQWVLTFELNDDHFYDFLSMELD